MIELARARSAGYPNVDYQVADVTAYDLPAERFDCVASIATLHHLPLEPTLARMAGSLKPGGTLLVLDLFQEEGLADRLLSLAAVPTSLGLRLLKTGRLRAPAEVRAAWAEHGRSDVYPALAQVRRACAAVLPGARVKRHLLWRYSIVWKKGARRAPRGGPRTEGER
jgi:SAM-dependent methyltransferase